MLWAGAGLFGSSRRVATAVVGVVLAASVVSGEVQGAEPAPFPDGQVAIGDDPDFLFGSELGAWPMLDQRYDGHPMLNYGGSCPGCPPLAREAGVSVVRWGIWNVFEGTVPPAGQAAPPLAGDQFDAVVDGIRTLLAAQPLLTLQPGVSSPAGLFCPENWGEANLIGLDSEVVTRAGARVQMYELGNEPELACGYAADWQSAGARAGQLWLRVASAVRKRARASGFEILLGGPAFTTTNVSPRDTDSLDVGMARLFMRTIKDAFDDPGGAYFHDSDIIPSFYSFHAYASEFLANGGTDALEAIPRYGNYIDDVRGAIDETWGPDVGPRIRIACTEWNYAADDRTDWSSPSVPEFYIRFLNMLYEHRVWLANQFLMASNGNGLDMITRDGRRTPAYEAFKAAGAGIVARSTIATP